MPVLANTGRTASGLRLSSLSEYGFGIAPDSSGSGRNELSGPYQACRLNEFRLLVILFAFLTGILLNILIAIFYFLCQEDAHPNVANQRHDILNAFVIHRVQY